MQTERAYFIAIAELRSPLVRLGRGSDQLRGGAKATRATGRALFAYVIAGLTGKAYRINDLDAYR